MGRSQNSGYSVANLSCVIGANRPHEVTAEGKRARACLQEARPLARSFVVTCDVERKLRLTWATNVNPHSKKQLRPMGDQHTARQSSKLLASIGHQRVEEMINLLLYICIRTVLRGRGLGRLGLLLWCWRWLALSRLLRRGRSGRGLSGRRGRGRGRGRGFCLHDKTGPANISQPLASSATAEGWAFILPPSSSLQQGPLQAARRSWLNKRSAECANGHDVNACSRCVGG